jgi:hypothetical protein
MNKLSNKFDAYDMRLTSMGSDFSMVQYQIDLAMRSILALPHEQIQLVKSLRVGHFAGSLDVGGIMGAVPDPVVPNTSSASATPSAPLPLQIPVPGTSSLPSSAHGSGSLLGSGDLEHRRPWIPKMDFPMFIFGWISAQHISIYTPFLLILGSQLHCFICRGKHLTGT